MAKLVVDQDKILTGDQGAALEALIQPRARMIAAA